MTALKAILVAFGLLTAIDVTIPAWDVRIDAGIQYDFSNFLFLLAGNFVMVIKDYKQLTVSTRRFLLRFNDDEPPICAAYQTFAPQKVLYYRNKSGVFQNYKPPGEKSGFKYGRKRKFLRNGGPDAAARRGKTVHFFKGCQMAVRRRFDKWEKPVNVSTVGLPCNVDAAWKHGDGMVILRGDQIWLWGEDNSVQGPRDFSSMYFIYSWKLLPYQEPVQPVEL